MSVIEWARGVLAVRRQAPDPAPAAGAVLVGGKRARTAQENVIRALLFLCGFVSVLTTIGIILSLFTEATGFIARPEVDVLTFLTGTQWRPLLEDAKPENFGVLPLLTGTLMITFLSALVAMPLGLGSAIYLSEYAADRVRRVLKPMLEILAGIPSVVYGYFALSLISPLIKSTVERINSTLGADVQVDFLNAASASIVLGIMILPLVASISEDAMRAVPRSLREGAFALGATRMEVALRVVVPAAFSGVVAGFILALSRAIGETMIVAVAAGATPRVTFNPLQSIQTMTAYIVQVSFGDNPVGSLGSQSIFAVGALLFTITFIMNVISNFILKRFREVYD
jgi:phosphate transport system permease protein